MYNGARSSVIISVYLHRLFHKLNFNYLILTKIFRVIAKLQVNTYKLKEPCRILITGECDFVHFSSFSAEAVAFRANQSPAVREDGFESTRENGPRSRG